MKRRYELKRRAEHQAATRQRIVEAAAELHTTVGPARTTISAIAARAGVQRQTVYGHFPDEATLFGACSRHWAGAHPFPDPAPWFLEVDPERRLRRALGDVYSWYGRVEPALSVLARDRELVQATAELMRARDQELSRLADALARGLPRRRAVRASVGHALGFETWRSLHREGLTQRAAADAMVRLVMSV